MSSDKVLDKLRNLREEYEADIRELRKQLDAANKRADAAEAELAKVADELGLMDWEK